MSKLITVFGATGNQGGSVISSILKHNVLSKEFRLRGVTRDPSKPSGEALAKRGVEVVKADLTDKESLRKAIAGSHSVFAVTNYWESMSKDAEITQGKNIADVCKEVNVQHLIWSTLPHVTTLSKGALPNVPHFDSKAEVDSYIRSIGVPMTSFEPGFYISNLKTMMPKGENDSYTLAWPVPSSTGFPCFDAARDTGKFVSAILRNRSELLGGRVLGASGFFTGSELVAAFEKASGKKGVYAEVSEEVFKGYLPPEIGQELLENLYLIRDYKYFGGEDAEGDLEKSLKLLDEKPTSLEEFMEKEAPW